MKIYAQLLGLSIFILTITGCSSPTSTPETPVSPAPARSPSPTANQTLTTDNSPGFSTGSISPAKAMLVDRAAHTATLLDSGKVLIAGGFGHGDNAYTDSTELYDPGSGNFVFTGKLPVGRCCHTATKLADGRVLIAGGFNGDYLSNAEIYDPLTGTFTPTRPLTTPRMDHVAVLLDNGKVLLAGGVGTGWTFLASAELYDPATGSFSPTGDMSVPRESHTITKLLDGRVLITGGHQGRHAAVCDGYLATRRERAYLGWLWDRTECQRQDLDLQP
jgi:hypothetical protein